MAFSKLIKNWLGATYSADDSAHTITLHTATHDDTVLGTVTVVAETNVLTVSADHFLKIGDKVRFTTTDTLPAGLAVLTDYYVLTVPSSDTLTVSATPGGTVLDITDTGTGTHSITTGPLLAQVTDAEADETTGDIRKLVFGIVDALHLAWSRIASADRPTRMTIYKSSQSSGTTLTHTFTIVFVNEVASEDVADEPA
jgi:hypothetical protein